MISILLFFLENDIFYIGLVLLVAFFCLIYVGSAKCMILNCAHEL